MSTLFRLTLAATVASLLLTGCADHQATKPTRPAATTTSVTGTSSTTSSKADASATTERERTTRTTAPGNTTATLPQETGIPACDDYLSSYLACHRAAKIYAPDQLQYRYEAMRTSLLRDSQNPDIRPQLGARCNSLANQLRQALHGKACTPEQAQGGYTP
jgi:hypothetical protein